MKIIHVDCNYVQEEFASAYLLIKNNRGLFVECNTNHAIPYLKQAAEREGLSPDQIEGLVITHVHLDHAGGSGLFLKEFKNAKLYAHPRAAKHVIDPSKLVSSATAVYGEALMQKLYGIILSCPAERVTVLQDEDEISFQGVQLKTKHTRGHANHHLVVIDPETKTLFSGDSFGVSYPAINQKRGLVAIASTSPTDFDGDQALAVIDWIASQDLERVGLTHFGFLNQLEIKKAALQLKDQIWFGMALVKKIRREHLSVDQVREHIHDWLIQYYEQRRQNFDSEDLKLLSLDMKVNAQGLHFAANRAE